MSVAHTRFSRLAIIAAGGLVLAQVVMLASVDTRYLLMMAGALLLVTSLATFKLCRDNCVESRLVTVTVAAVSALGIALNSTLGLPGAAPEALDARSSALLALSLAVLLLIALDGPSRRRIHPRESPYAL